MRTETDKARARPRADCQELDVRSLPEQLDGLFRIVAVAVRVDGEVRHAGVAHGLDRVFLRKAQNVHATRR